ncbi:MAG: ATP-binding protein, partial [Planctomycetota bacterium]
SASSAFDDAEAILRMMVGGGDGVPVVIGRNEHRTELIDPSFVGRESQLAKLQDELHDVADGQWKRILVACASGMGKSRLNNEISRLATRNGFQVLHGDSIERATTEPNAPWMQIVAQVAKDCRADETTRTRLSAAMDDYREEVITAMPALAEVFGCRADD